MDLCAANGALKSVPRSFDSPAAIWRAARIILDIRLQRGEIGVAEAVDFLVDRVGHEGKKEGERRRSHRIIWVWTVSESSLPASSVTRVCQTCVRRPR